MEVSEKTCLNICSSGLQYDLLQLISRNGLNLEVAAILASHFINFKWKKTEHAEYSGVQDCLIFKQVVFAVAIGWYLDKFGRCFEKKCCEQ